MRKAKVALGIAVCLVALGCKQPTHDSSPSVTTVSKPAPAPTVPELPNPTTPLPNPSSQVYTVNNDGTVTVYKPDGSALTMEERPAHAGVQRWMFQSFYFVLNITSGVYLTNWN